MSGELDTIRIRKEHIDFINMLSDNVSDSEAAFKMAAKMRREALCSFWEIIDKCYPKTKDYVCHYNSDRKIIILERKKMENEND